MAGRRTPLPSLQTSPRSRFAGSAGARTRARSEDDDLIAFAEACEGDAAANALLSALFGNSRYLSHCLIADQAFARLLIDRGPEAAYAAAREMAADISILGDETRQQVMKRLRVAKRRASLAIGMADVLSVWPLERVTGALSDIASTTLSAVCAHLLRALHDRGKLALPDPDAPERGSGLIILGMGKLGAGELNYSSDVDIIVLFDEEIASDPSVRRLAADFRPARPQSSHDHGRADGRWLRVPYRPPPPPRPRLHCGRPVGPRRRGLLRDHRRELGAGRHDQGEARSRRHRRRNWLPGAAPTLHLAPSP